MTEQQYRQAALRVLARRSAGDAGWFAAGADLMGRWAADNMADAEGAPFIPWGTPFGDLVAACDEERIGRGYPGDFGPGN